MPDRDVNTFSAWPLGIDNVNQETALPRGALRDALNVDINRAGKIRPRKGYEEKYTGAGIHSLHSSGNLCLFVEGSSLKRFWPDNTATTLRSDMNPNKYVSYCQVNTDIYYSNEDQLGIINTLGELKDWGVETPSGVPLVSAVSGGTLTAGKYQVAITFMAADGSESGSPLTTVLTVEDGQTIQLDDIPQSSAAYVNIYVSEPNGDTLYHQVRIAMGVLTYRISSVSRSKALTTLFAERFPAGSIIRYYNGRVYAVVGNALVFSEALNYGLYRRADNYFLFSETPTVVEPVSDGLYIVADQTYFLAGNDPKNINLVVVSPQSGIAGTGISIPSSKLGTEEAKEDIAFWYADNGATIGLPGGVVRPVMENRVAIPAQERGATLFREEEGIRHLVTALSGYGEDAPMGMGDDISTEVIRNGVLI